MKITCKTIKEKDRKRQEKILLEQKQKTYKGEWYTVNSIFGNDWAIFYCLLGGRETGKSYSAMRWGVNRKLKIGDKFKFYWFRLSESSAQKLLVGGADKLVDPDLQRKYGIKTFTKGSDVFTYEPKFITQKNGVEKEIKANPKQFATVLSCATFYNTKGVGYFDNEFTANGGEYFIVLDEMNREQSEKNTFDIVYNFVNLLENVVRSTKTRIKVVMIGNTLEETSDILSAFNFIPDTFGRYKLKSKRCVIDYIKPNEEYKKRRKGTIADIMSGNSSTFTNEVMLDRSLLVNKRLCTKPQYVIKFSKDRTRWFTVWNGNIIKQYNKESKPAIAMIRYLDEVYDVQVANSVIEQFDNRAFKFTNLSVFKRFQKELRLIKKK